MILFKADKEVTNRKAAFVHCIVYCVQLACLHCLHPGVSCLTITATAFQPTLLFLAPFFLLAISASMPESSYQLESDLVSHFLKRLYNLPSLILKSPNLKMTCIQYCLYRFPHWVLTLDSAVSFHTPGSCWSLLQHPAQASLARLHAHCFCYVLHRGLPWTSYTDLQLALAASYFFLTSLVSHLKAKHSIPSQENFENVHFSQVPCLQSYTETMPCDHRGRGWGGVKESKGHP